MKIQTLRKGQVPAASYITFFKCENGQNNQYVRDMYNLFVRIHSVFQWRNIVCQTDDKDIQQNIL